MKNQTKAYLALAFIAIVWGTTYLAIRVAVMQYPAFLMAAVRQATSALIIMGIGYGMSRKVDLSTQNIKQQALVGFLLITLGNGLVSWAEKYVPSGVAALICSMMPIVTVIINLTTVKGERINASIIIGMLLGFAGIALIFKDDLDKFGSTEYLLGIICVFVATSSWALGSVLNKKRTSKINPIFNSGMQVAFGGLFLFILSPFVDSYDNLVLWQPDAFWSLVYLIIFGSVLAYTAYMYALKELPVALVSTYAYVNPLVAVILGYFILSEPLTWFTALAFLSIMIGVFLVNRGYRQQPRVTEAEVKEVEEESINSLPANAEMNKS
ncbi:MAG: EamA family transporter [Sphingobacteriales bacterium]|nr:MAG: EamA family transporter [Sphingobacteriales bacterium]